MTLWESLKKTFLSQPKDRKKETKNLSTTSDPSRIELAPSSEELPINYNIKPKNTLRKKNEEDIFDKEDRLIRDYRTISKIPEVSSAIDEIVNEVMSVKDDGVNIPSLSFVNDTNISKNIQKTILEKYDKIMGLLDYSGKGDDLFRKWYIDSKLVAEIIYNNKNIKQGIVDIYILNPIGLRKKIDEDGNIYYVYKDITQKFNFEKTSKDYYKPEQIVISDSGLIEDGLRVGYLYYALKAVNNLTTIEDSFIIYRILRAIETRIWNVNVAKLPKSKAEQYINNVINSIRSELSYDPSTGEFKGRQTFQSLINDYVFPTRNGNESTSVDTIGGNTRFIDSVEDHEIFLKKLYIAMKIPVSRIDVTTSTMDFTGTDILRAEEKFTKFINKLRRKFSQFILNLLKLELIATNTISESEWKDIKQDIKIIWPTSNQIIENGRLESYVKKSEVYSDLKSNGIIGTVLSHQWALENIFKMTKEEFEEQRKLIEEETKEGIFDTTDEEEY